MPFFSHPNYRPKKIQVDFNLILFVFFGSMAGRFVCVYTVMEIGMNFIFDLLYGFFVPLPKSNRYTNQQDMLAGSGIHRGVCQPLSNAWLESQIDGSGSDFLKDKNEALQRTLAVNEAQKKMGELKQDYKNYAFVKTNTPYIKIDVPVTTLTEPTGLKSILKDHQFSLFTYTTKNYGIRHTVAFLNDDKKMGRCKLFDPDLYGGEVKGPCDPVIALLALRLLQSANTRATAKSAVITLSTSTQLNNG